jgi:hypothetical protein
MPAFLKELPEVINGIFNVLDLVIFRLMLLGLAGIGAYALIRGHLH